jgi:hypothetical protein
MWAKRLDRQVDVEVDDGGSAVGAFMAVPATMGGAASYQQLYHWAYEQAKQSVQICRPAPMRDLFAVMN